jgi:transposase
LRVFRNGIALAGIEACPLSEWLHRGLCEAGIPVVCIEVRHAQRFLSSRPVKTDRNDARGIADMMRLGHYRPVHVKSPAAQAMRTTLAVRMQLVAAQLQIENTIRGLLKVYGLKIGAIHRNRFAARVTDLLGMASLPELAAAIEPLLRIRENMRAERTLSRGDVVARRLMTIPGVGQQLLCRHRKGLRSRTRSEIRLTASTGRQRSSLRSTGGRWMAAPKTITWKNGTVWTRPL